MRFVVVFVALFLVISPSIYTVQFALSDSVITTVKVGNSPSEMVFNPINSSMYVINSNSISVLDAHTNKFLMDIQFPPQHFLGKIAFNPINNNMYLTFGNNTGDYIAVISAKDNKVIDNINMDTVIDDSHLLLRTPNAIAYNPINGNMYVPSVVSYYDTNASSFTNSRNTCLRNVTITCVVSVIDTEHNQVINNIPVGRQGEGDGVITFDEKNGYGYVANYQDKSISIIDPKSNQVIKSLSLSGTPSAIAYNQKNGNMYVVGGPSNVVSVIDQINIVKHITGVGLVPNSIAYNPKNGNMYVLGGFSKSVFVIDSEHNQVINNTMIGTGQNDFPNSIAYNPKNGNMYATIGFSDVVKVIDSTSNQVIDTVPVREGALKITLDPINNEMYVTNNINDTVSVIG